VADLAYKDWNPVLYILPNSILVVNFFIGTKRERKQEQKIVEETQERRKKKTM
jgi:cytochrome c-type biogenesis protein CcmH/NrfF